MPVQSSNEIQNQMRKVKDLKNVLTLDYFGIHLTFEL
jgi:hypothetical protein